MAAISKDPGTPGNEPIESRRSALSEPDPATAESPAGNESPVDLPGMGEFAAESARMTPLDDIAEIEREQLPRD